MIEPLDTLIKNVRIVRPRRTSVDLLDIGIKDGKFARLAPEIPPTAAKEVIDGHNGIFRPIFLNFLRQLCDDRVRRVLHDPLWPDI